MTNKIAHKKFSLIDLLMIIIVVGIVITFIVPLKQVKEDRRIIFDTVKTMEKIAQKNLEFIANFDISFGENAFDIGQLNLGNSIDETYFTFKIVDDYLPEDEPDAEKSTVLMATSTANFSAEGVHILYFLPNGPFQVGEDAKSRKYIDPNWLP